MPADSASSGATRALILTAVVFFVGFLGFVYTTNRAKAIEARLPDTALPFSATKVGPSH